MFCPKCGATLPDNAQFCGSCGSKVDARGAEGAQTAAQQPMPAAQQSVAPAPPDATGGAAVARRGIPKAAVAAGLALVVVAAIVAAGLLTNWFGLANSPVHDMANNPVYVMTKSTRYAASGDKSNVTERELDDRGNVVKQVTKNYSADKTYTHTAEFENDQNGFPEKSTTTTKIDNGDTAKHTTKYKSEFDNQERLVQVKTKLDGQTTTTSYEYYDNGNVKTVEQETKPEPSDGSANRSVSSSEYDELGYITSISAETSVDDSITRSTEYEFEWALEASNAPTGYELSAKRYDGSETRKGSDKFTIETDGHGNITAIYDGKDNLVAEYEYELVNNPSLAARLSALSKPCSTAITFDD